MVNRAVIVELRSILSYVRKQLVRAELEYGTANERESRARRQLRGICRGLVEADEANDLASTHRSVRDFFKQGQMQIEMRDQSFNDMDALSQLKLASMRRHWWDAE